MTKALVYNIEGEGVGEVELSPKIFAIKFSPALIHQVVVAERANARNTVAHTKTRGEVRGGGKKPWRQKGTGRARAGSIRSPLWRGGGVIFGPRPIRNYSQKVNRSQFRNGLFMALSDKLVHKNLLILDRFNIEKISTEGFRKTISNLRGKLNLSPKSFGIVIPGPDKVLERSARNLPDVKVLRVPQLSCYQLLKHHVIVILKDALPVIERLFVK